MIRRALLLLLVGAALATGCATRTAPPAAPRPQPPSASAVPAPTEAPRVATPAAYLARAGSYDLLMTLAGEMAGRRSNNPAVQQLARRLAEEHRGLAGQLSLAGRRLNLLPSRTLLPNHQGWLEELGGAADFDAGYRRLARRVHQNSYHMHAAFAANGGSPTLRPVARNAAEVERRHWAELPR